MIRIKKNDKIYRNQQQIKDEIIYSFHHLINSKERKRNIYHIVLNQLKQPLKIKKNYELKRIQKEIYFKTRSLLNQFSKRKKEEFLFVIEYPKEFSIGKNYFKDKSALPYHLHILYSSNLPYSQFKKSLLNKVSMNQTLSLFENDFFEDISERTDIKDFEKYFVKQNDLQNNDNFYYQINKPSLKPK